MAAQKTSPADKTRAGKTTTATRGTAKSSIAGGITASEVQNCTTVVPNIGNGNDYKMRLKRGRYKVKNDSVNGYEEGSIGPVCSGVLNGKPVAVAQLTWNTGGSGYWNALILFERVKGKVVGTRDYSLSAPANSGTLKNMQVGPSNVTYDVVGARLGPNEFEGSSDDSISKDIHGAAYNAPTTNEIMKSIAVIPDKDGNATTVQMQNGVGQKDGITCRIKGFKKMQIGDQMLTVAAAKLQQKGEPEHWLLLKYSHQDRLLHCDGYFQIPGQPQFRKVVNLRLEEGQIGFDTLGNSLTLADFEKPNY